ncbi:MAG TPA: AI-2E family transporter [Bacteroidia bacterium]|nr:AI-2E family transporter [Bacteroidia bacterium]
MRYPFYFKLASVLVCLVFGTIILIYAKDFLLPLLISILISFLLYPLCKKMEKKKIPPILAISFSLLLVLFIFMFSLFLISSQLSSMLSDMKNLNQIMAAKLNGLHDYITSNYNISNQTLNSWIVNAKSSLLGHSGEFLSGTFSTTTEILTYFGLVPVYVFCFLLYRKSFRDFAFSMLHTQKHAKLNELLQDIQKLSQNYLIGLFTVIAIIGTLNTVGLWIIGVDYALFFGFFASLLTIIPYIGIFIGSLLPIAFSLLTMDSVWAPIGIIIVFTLVQFLESNFITPKVVGSSVSINPFAAIVALLIGGELWGAAGMILSIPVTAILKVVFDSRTSTKAIGYFLGSELTDTRDNPADTLTKTEA